MKPPLSKFYAAVRNHDEALLSSPKRPYSLTNRKIEPFFLMFRNASAGPSAYASRSLELVALALLIGLHTGFRRRKWSSASRFPISVQAQTQQRS